MVNTTSDKSKPVDKFIELGANMAGGVAGAAVGFFTGGPAGALIGAAFGPALAHAVREVGSDLYNRHLSQREMARIGAVMFYAAEKFRENIENGQQIRQDGFFQEQPGERADAEEIVEGILLSAQREHEEKKLNYYGNLLANIAFHPKIDKAQANLLIRMGQRVSYRQMCLLALFAHSDSFNLRQGDYRASEIDTDRIPLLQEIHDLYSQGLLNCSGNALLGMRDIIPANMNVQGMGATLHNLMELCKVDAQNLNTIAVMLK